VATKDELLTDVLRLPSEQRAEVALELLLSLEEEEEEEEAEAAWGQEVAERAQEVLDGTVKTVPWSEVQARISARLGRRR
jgi:putative addiction module component (TIGR02574 family)